MFAKPSPMFYSGYSKPYTLYQGQTVKKDKLKIRSTKYKSKNTHYSSQKVSSARRYGSTGATSTSSTTKKKRTFSANPNYRTSSNGSYSSIKKHHGTNNFISPKTKTSTLKKKHSKYNRSHTKSKKKLKSPTTNNYLSSNLASSPLSDLLTQFKTYESSVPVPSLSNKHIFKNKKGINFSYNNNNNDNMYDKYDQTYVFRNNFVGNNNNNSNNSNNRNDQYHPIVGTYNTSIHGNKTSTKHKKHHTNMTTKTPRKTRTQTTKTQRKSAVIPTISSKLQKTNMKRDYDNISPLSNILAKYSDSMNKSESKTKLKTRVLNKYGLNNDNSASIKRTHSARKLKTQTKPKTKTSTTATKVKSKVRSYNTTKKPSMMSMDKYNDSHNKNSIKNTINESNDIDSSYHNNSVNYGNSSNNNLYNKRTKSKSDPWNVKTLSLSDLKIKSMLGEGAFSKVYLVKFKKTQKISNNIDTQLHSKNLACKVIDTKNKSTNDQSLEWERFVLSQMNNPFIVQYYGSFIDRNKLCILTEFVIGGEILFHFENSKYGRFDNNATQFYIGEIMSALEYLHKKGYVYRDLKPENILLDSDGHVKLVDFGFAKKLRKHEKTYTLCGSKEYVAPEVLIGHGHSFAADYWSLGVLTYEFIVGYLPFPTQECNPYEVLGIIENTQIEFPSYIDKNCVDFISKLLVYSPAQRLGCQKVNNNQWTSDTSSSDSYSHRSNSSNNKNNRNSGIDDTVLTSFNDLKNHTWFQSTNFNWKLCHKRGLQPPIIPKYASNDDASNFATARFDIDTNTQQQSNAQPTPNYEMHDQMDLVSF